MKEIRRENVELDKYTIGGEKGSPIGGAYVHVKEDEKPPLDEAYNVSIRGDIDSIDVIEYEPNDEPYDMEDEDEVFEPTYDINAYDRDGEYVLCGELTIDEILDYFDEGILHMLTNHEGRKVSSNVYMIDDLLMRNTTPSDVNNVEEVNKMAKKLSTGGPSQYLLVDGDTIAFHDHIYITSIDGMTPSKFLSLGNIRLGNNSIELMKEPTQEQCSELKRFIQGKKEIYLDISKYTEGSTYGRNIVGACYYEPNPNRVVNDIVNYFENGIKPLGNMAFESRRRYKYLVENLGLEVSKDEVDLSTLSKKNSLNPKIWDGMRLNPKIRLKLLDIADDFWDFVDVKWVDPISIILTGSICNYNWSEASDIDLHLVVDYSKVDEKTEFVKQFFDMKRNEWNDKHSALEMMGFKVELYVQDSNSDVTSDGIYDLEENKWVSEPTRPTEDFAEANEDAISDVAAKIMTLIDDLEEEISLAKDEYKARYFGELASELVSHIYKMRHDSLENQGELSVGNMVYKILRRSGYIDKIFDAIYLSYDKENSIDEQKERLNEYLDKNYNYPLVQYFRAMSKASDKEKVVDLCYEVPSIMKEYIEDMMDSSPYSDEFYELSEEGVLEAAFDDYDDESINKIVDVIERNKLGAHCISTVENIASNEGAYMDLPAWMTMDFEGVVKNEWCIHFTNDANNIARYGFKYGTEEIERLAYTKRQAKGNKGYDFAFLVDDRLNTNYGNEAVLFRTSGVKVTHYGDQESQVVFWGGYAKDFIPIYKNSYNGEWEICSAMDGRTLYSSEDIDDLITWAMRNHFQYRKHIIYDRTNAKDVYYECITESADIFSVAKEKFGTTSDLREGGFILPDGSVLDFSGRHALGASKWQIGIRGRRTCDHNDIGDIMYDNDGHKVEGIDDIDKYSFMNLGAVRIDYDCGLISLVHEPTPKQLNVMKAIWRYNKGCLTVDLFDSNGDVRDSVEYDHVKWTRFVSDLDKYFNEGINPSSSNNMYYEEISRLKPFVSLLSEEIVADGNSEHNPYSKRWKQEREALKSFITNYGKIMTSKENGKEYMVYYDDCISNLIGINYVLCVQWDNLKMKPKSTVYIRALDKFTNRRFQANNDTRGRDNQIGTNDDIAYQPQQQ